MRSFPNTILEVNLVRANDIATTKEDQGEKKNGHLPEGR